MSLRSHDEVNEAIQSASYDLVGWGLQAEKADWCYLQVNPVIISEDVRPIVQRCIIPASQNGVSAQDWMAKLDTKLGLLATECMKGVVRTSREAGEGYYYRLQRAHREKDVLHAWESRNPRRMLKALNALNELKKGRQGKVKLVCLSANDILEMDCPPRGYVLQTMIPEQGVAMLYATRGIGKTFGCLSIGHAVATGGSVWGFDAPKSRRVLYVDGEMALASLKERLAMIMSGAGLIIPDEGALDFVTPDAQGGDMPDITSVEGQSALDGLVEPYDLIILDNLSALSMWGRENEAESWKPIKKWLLSLKRKGKSILIVHHAGKGGGQRGTSAKEDILDTVLALRRPKDYAPEQGAKFEIHFEKARSEFGEAVKPLVATLRSTDDDALFWETVELKAEQQDRIKAMSAAGKSLREISDELGMSKSTVQRRLKAA